MLEAKKQRPEAYRLSLLLTICWLRHLAFWLEELASRGSAPDEDAPSTTASRAMVSLTFPRQLPI